MPAPISQEGNRRRQRYGKGSCLAVSFAGTLDAPRRGASSLVFGDARSAFDHISGASMPARCLNVLLWTTASHPYLDVVCGRDGYSDARPMSQQTIRNFLANVDEDLRQIRSNLSEPSL